MRTLRKPVDDSPLNDYDIVSCLLRFFSTAAFGLIVDIVLIALFLIMFLMGYSLSLSSMFTILLAVPLAWGILGIFFFQDILDITNEIFSTFFSSFR